MKRIQKPSDLPDIQKYGLVGHFVLGLARDRKGKLHPLCETSTLESAKRLGATIGRLKAGQGFQWYDLT